MLQSTFLRASVTALAFGLLQVAALATTTYIQGDYSGDGYVNNADLNLVLNNWGVTSSTLPTGWNGALPSGSYIDKDEISAISGNWGNGTAPVDPLPLRTGGAIQLSIDSYDKVLDSSDYVVNDFTLNYSDTLRGQQLTVELEQGEIYQHYLGGEFPLPEAIYYVFPSLEFDTYVTLGGWGVITSQDATKVGGAVDIILGDRVAVLNTSEISFAWTPAGGVEIPSGTDFPVARVTLSSDARGFASYLGTTANGDYVYQRLPIINGRVVPEPTSAVLLGGLAIACGLGLRVRRSV